MPWLPFTIRPKEPIGRTIQDGYRATMSVYGTILLVRKERFRNSGSVSTFSNIIYLYLLLRSLCPPL